METHEEPLTSRSMASEVNSKRGSRSIVALLAEKFNIKPVEEEVDWKPSMEEESSEQPKSARPNHKRPVIPRLAKIPAVVPKVSQKSYSALMSSRLPSARPEVGSSVPGELYEVVQLRKECPSPRPKPRRPNMFDEDLACLLEIASRSLPGWSSNLKSDGSLTVVQVLGSVLRAALAESERNEKHLASSVFEGAQLTLPMPVAIRDSSAAEQSEEIRKLLTKVDLIASRLDRQRVPLSDPISPRRRSDATNHSLAQERGWRACNGNPHIVPLL